MRAKAICDGRGNAGTGARAVVLILDDGQVIERAERLQATTNIVAEHLAIQLSIEVALEYGVTDLLILNDSQTPVFQVDGSYRVKQEHLKPIVKETWELGSRLNTVSIQWVPREKTTLADRLCRDIDKEPAARPNPMMTPGSQRPFTNKRHAIRTKRHSKKRF